MPFRYAKTDPGTADFGPWWPFRVVPMENGWVQVQAGELWRDPKLGGELIPIQGLYVPFQVNEKSLIYLQVWLDPSGRPIHAAICHTGLHLDWLADGERWLNWPKMYAVDMLPYYGLQNRDTTFAKGAQASSTALDYSASWAAYPGYDRQSTLVEDENIFNKYFPLQWMQDRFTSSPANGVETGACRETQSQAKPDKDITLSIHAGGHNPALGRGNGIDGGAAGGNLGGSYAGIGNAGAYNNDDPIVTNVWERDQVYQGVERELRKEVGAQRYVGWYPDNTQHTLCNGGGPPWIYRRATVSTYENQEGGDEDECMEKIVGNAGGFWKSSSAGRIGGHYYPGYLDWKFNGRWMPTNVAGAYYYAQIFDSIGSKLALQPSWKQTAAPWHKKRKTEYDQMMVFYPIAYAAPLTRHTPGYWSGFMVQGGYKVLKYPKYETVAEGNRQEGSSGDREEFQLEDETYDQENDFKMVQACKTNLQMVDMMEGDYRIKQIVPYQGMAGHVLTSANGIGYMRMLNFQQDYEFHKDSDPVYERKKMSITDLTEVDDSTRNKLTGDVIEAVDAGSPSEFDDDKLPVTVPEDGTDRPDHPWEWGRAEFINGAGGPITSGKTYVVNNEDFYPLSQNYLDKMFNLGGSQTEEEEE